MYLTKDLLKVHSVRAVKNSRARGVDAMTVAIGFQCSDGVVLCSDRQITKDGGLKYEERKLGRSSQMRWITTKERQDVNFAIAYCGDPDLATVYFENIRLTLRDYNFGNDPKREFVMLLRQISKNKKAAPSEVLIAGWIRRKNYCALPFLLRGRGETIVDGYREFIGVGDCSALRYLASFIFSEEDRLSVHDAGILGSYMVSIANRFVDRCQGGPDLIVLDQEGGILECTNLFSHQEERFLFCEKQIGARFRELLLSGGLATQSVSER